MRLVYDYRQYRDFLRDFYRLQKEKNPSFSYSVFARQCGLSSPAHIQLILSGKRNLTVHNIHRLADGLALPEGERDFFESLVHLNQAETPSEKRCYEKRLTRLGVDKPQSSARLKVSRLLSSALFPALLLSIEGKALEPAVLAGQDRFGYSGEEIRTLLDQLLVEGVIALVGGKIRLSQRHLILNDKRTRHQAQKIFLRQQLILSTKVFDRLYENGGKFYAHTFTIGKQTAERYDAEFKALFERMTKLSDESPSDDVMQLNIQFFPYLKEFL